MNLRSVVFGFFVLLAATLNFGFVVRRGGGQLANLVSVVLLVMETVSLKRR